ncbi:MAG: hemerythrin domain-containing protein [Alphaproteobacteria bacterium]
MDIYSRIRQDHERQRELAAQLADTHGDSPDRKRLFDSLAGEIEAHANAEEQTFYASLIAIPEGQEQARHSVSEHKEAADLLEELQGMDMSAGGWLVKFRKLKDELEHHMDEEESEVFRLARNLIDEDEAARLGADFDRRKANELAA